MLDKVILTIEARNIRMHYDQLVCTYPNIFHSQDFANKVHLLRKKSISSSDCFDFLTDRHKDYLKPGYGMTYDPEKDAVIITKLISFKDFTIDDIQRCRAS